MLPFAPRLSVPGLISGLCEVTFHDSRASARTRRRASREIVLAGGI